MSSKLIGKSSAGYIFILMGLYIVFVGLAACSKQQTNERTKKVSEFGVYSGYFEPLYSEFSRESIYVPVRDGTKLALDIFRPVKDGKTIRDPSPVLLVMTRYGRAKVLANGNVSAFYMGELAQGKDSYPIELAHWSSQMLRYGYTLVVGDNRGSGASFGKNTGAISKSNMRDNYDVIEWIAKQSWSSGNVGMAGDSQMGTNQYTTLTERPPHLKAIFPGVANFDFYRAGFAGGVLHKGGILMMRQVLVDMANNRDPDDASMETKAAPVDADADGSQRDLARSEHGDGLFSNYLSFLKKPVLQEIISDLGLETEEQVVSVLFITDKLLSALEARPDLQEKLMSVGFYRDDMGARVENRVHPSENTKDMSAAGIPVYAWSGWLDPFPGDAFLFFANLDVPMKVAVGPWGHSAPLKSTAPRHLEYHRLRTIEHLRWFDYWLKGIDNGIMDDPKVHYAVVKDNENWQWQGSDEWPPSTGQLNTLYFNAGRSGTVNSVNDGLLTDSEPDNPSDRDSYIVDYHASVGVRTRLAGATGAGDPEYGDLSDNDAKGLTYTSEPFEQDVEIIGYPIVTLFASASSKDAEFSIYLEEVKPDGHSRFLTDGFTRASHRALGESPYNNLGVPFQTSLSVDNMNLPPLTDAIAKIEFALEPLARRIAKGNRIRVSILGADANNTWTFPSIPAQQVSIWRSDTHQSKIELPIITQ